MTTVGKHEKPASLLEERLAAKWGPMSDLREIVLSYENGDMSSSAAMDEVVDWLYVYDNVIDPVMP